jgi:hypothetical protein
MSLKEIDCVIAKYLNKHFFHGCSIFPMSTKYGFYWQTKIVNKPSSINRSSAPNHGWKFCPWKIVHGKTSTDRAINRHKFCKVAENPYNRIRFLQRLPGPGRLQTGFLKMRSSYDIRKKVNCAGKEHTSLHHSDSYNCFKLADQHSEKSNRRL